MRQYKILLVDDEEEIRRGIIRRIKWQELGFEVVGEAENGVEALDQIERYTPDVVVTDIKMPFMDGIRLAENIHDRYPTTKVIILSGFDDFEYAREALKLGVMRYILKPINSYEMHELLREVKAKLDDEIASKQNVDLLRQNYKKSLPLLKERFLNRWIEEYIPLEEIKTSLDELGLVLNSEALGVVSVRRDEYAKEEDVSAIKNESLLKLALFNICEEITREEQLGVFFMGKLEMILITPLGEGEYPKSSMRLYRGLEQMRRAASKYLGTTVTIGIGNRCTDWRMLYKSYAAAVGALAYSITVGKNKLIYIEDVEPESGSGLLVEEEEERVLLTAIKVGRTDEVIQVIDQMLGRLEGNRVSLRDYQIYIVGIFASMMRLGHSMEVDMGKILPQEMNFFGMLSKLHTKEAISGWLTQVCLGMVEVLGTKRATCKNELIEQALAYIHTHYMEEDISAEVVCQTLHISTTYFSALFKKEMQTTFSTYLTQVRIERAKELLRTTDKKAIEIGSSVGYPEGHYFSYVFKKTTGIAPTEYRHGKV
ncbi:MAG: response regulator [Cellulosilyticaceae bacterium]